MSALPRVDEELARAISSGLCCQDCFAQFTREHGEPVSCSHCMNRRAELGIKEMVARARHPEANSAAWAARNRKRKQQRNR